VRTLRTVIDCSSMGIGIGIGALIAVLGFIGFSRTKDGTNPHYVSIGTIAVGIFVAVVAVLTAPGACF